MTEPKTPLPLRGDEDALFRQYHARLVANVRRRVNTSEAAIEDACQHAWVQMLRCQPDRENLVGWLSVTAQREAVRMHRRDSRELTLADNAGRPHGLLDHAGPTRDDGATVDAHRALQAVAGLKPRQRRVLEPLIAGYSYHEIMAMTATTYTAVNRHLTRARAALRRVRDQEAPA